MSTQVGDQALDDQGHCARSAAFWHGALFYRGQDHFLAGCLPFISAAIDAGEPVLVVVGGAKIELIRTHLCAHAAKVEFADMDTVGRNPAQIIPAWSDFVRDHDGEGPLRGIGEPIGPDRDADELAECELHENLINVAFGKGPAWQLLCPYDVDLLRPHVVAQARRSHPFVVEAGVTRPSPDYEGVERLSKPAPLPEPTAAPVQLPFDTDSLARMRRSVFKLAVEEGFDADRATEAVIAVNEAATNSLTHGGGRGVLRAWVDDGTLIFEVRDSGQIHEALVGRQRPGHDGATGRGLWMVNHLCELVQIRSSPSGSAVRMHFRGMGPASSSD
jgi:anti-sigma regulatory factor (Ser/Thr protein kinase)